MLAATAIALIVFALFIGLFNQGGQQVVLGLLVLALLGSGLYHGISYLLRLL